MRTVASERDDRQMERGIRIDEEYSELERRYFLKNRPQHISEWFWRVIWEDFIMRTDYADAARDAKDMAIDLGVSTTVRKYFEDSDEWFATPTAYGMFSELGDSGNKALLDHRINLLEDKKYPNIARGQRHEIKRRHNEERASLKAIIDRRQLESK